MTEPGDTSDDNGTDDPGGILGEVGLDYDEDGDDEADQGDDASENNDAETEPDNGPFAPEPGMNLTKSFGTKLTPPEKEFIEKYVEFSDQYENPGVFLRAFVTELRQEHGEEVMRRKKALEELKGGL